jgi:protocatechuate 3,4-dioxygenase beta subunit
MPSSPGIIIGIPLFSRIMRTIIALIMLTCACGMGNNDSGIPKQDMTDPDIRLVGGPCEGCEAVFEYGDRVLTDMDTLPDFNVDGPKLKISGTIYQYGGKQPAPGVILYIYHTNREGIYPTRGGERGWERRHGYIRGWVKTGSDGRYTFYTLVPGAYPDRMNPKHIHPVILEPDGKYYYIEEFLFHGDPNLTMDRIERQNPRGGDGYVLDLLRQNGMLVAHRDIELGKNIPGYNERGDQ